MIKKVVPCCSVTDVKSYTKLVKSLSKEFKDWTFVDMGSVAQLPASVHLHVRSSKSDEKGVLEITFAPSLGSNVELKIANNRKSEWSQSALVLLEHYLKKLKVG